MIRRWVYREYKGWKGLVCAVTATILMGGGIGILISPAFNPELAGYNVLGFIPLFLGLRLL